MSAATLKSLKDQASHREGYWQSMSYSLKNFQIFSNFGLTVLMLLFGVIAGLIAGFGFPLRYLIEGQFGYLYVVVVILTGVIFLKAYEASGALHAIMRMLSLRFGNYPLLFLFLCMPILYFPSMFTGLGTTGVVISGGLLFPILLRLGMSKGLAAAFVSTGAMLGSITGPVNVNVMIIANSINMPYEGFGLVLPAITIPLGAIMVLVLGLKPALKAEKGIISKGIEEKPDALTGFKIYLPLIVVVTLFLLPRIFPLHFPDPSTPLTFMIGTIFSYLINPKVKIGQVLLSAVDSPILEVAAILIAAGVAVEIAALTGIKGWLVVGSMSLPGWLIYISMLIALPLIGGAITMLGAAALFGLPFVLSLLGKNVIVVTAAVAALCALSQLTPPTAIVGKVAGEIVGAEKYGDVLKQAAIPLIVIALYNIGFILFANQIAEFLI